MKVDRSTVKGTLQYNNGDANENVNRDYFNWFVSLKSSDRVRAQLYYLAIRLL